MAISQFRLQVVAVAISTIVGVLTSSNVASACGQESVKVETPSCCADARVQDCGCCEISAPVSTPATSGESLHPGEATVDSSGHACVCVPASPASPASLPEPRQKNQESRPEWLRVFASTLVLKHSKPPAYSPVDHLAVLAAARAPLYLRYQHFLN